MFGKHGHLYLSFIYLINEGYHLLMRKTRGAYCAMVMIVLLDLPMDLPPEASARDFGHDTFVSGLPEYLSRCMLLLSFL